LTRERGCGNRRSAPRQEANGRRGKKKTEHALTDHLYGWDVAHVHADDSDHDHDHDFDADDGPLEDNPLWLQDNVALTTVGIDIGSSGTQVIFSKVHLPGWPRI